MQGSNGTEEGFVQKNFKVTFDMKCSRFQPIYKGVPSADLVV